MCECPGCGAVSTLESFFYCSKQPVNENVLFDTADAALSSPVGVIDMRFCENCGLVFNNGFSYENVDYGEDYKYCAPPTPIFRQFMTGLADMLVDKYGVKDCRVIELGCGQGEFLRLVCDKGRNEGFGFDTAYDAVNDHQHDSNVTIEASFYDQTRHIKDGDLACARQVVEHIKSPGELVGDIAASVSVGGKIYIEVPNLEWILENTVLWDFYYEHCSYFTARTLEALCAQFGIESLNVERLFSDQYIGLIGAKMEVSRSNNTLSRELRDLHNKIQNFAERAAVRRGAIQDRCSQLSARGAWCIWGGAAKGVTFCNLFSDWISGDFSVIDINPIRQEKYVPVTGFPIKGPEHLLHIRPHTIVVMNSNYIDEIKDTVSEMGLNCDILACDTLA